MRPCPYYIHLAQEIQHFFVNNHRIRRHIQLYIGSDDIFRFNYTESCLSIAHTFVN